MLGIHDLPLFVASGLLLNITPGPDLLFITGRAAAQGFKTGAVASLGVGAGCCVHILAAAFGLSALLAASSTAFTFIKLAGACYLAYVGLSMIRSAGQSRPAQAAPDAAPKTVRPASLRKIFVQGFLTNALNPKVALFFLAFLPQFIDPAAPGKALAFLVLGGIFNLNGQLVCLLFAWAAARALSKLRGGGLSAWFNRGIGGLFVFLGVRLAFSDRI